MASKQFLSTIKTNPTQQQTSNAVANEVERPLSTSSKVSFVVACYAPVVTLILRASSSLSPLEYRQNEDIYISSNIEYDCHQSISMTTQWVIHSTSSGIDFNSSMSRELYIPSRTLPLGLYEMKLTVTVFNISSSQSVFVRIVPSGIAANLIEYGTSMITHGYQQDLKLDPGKFSIDFGRVDFNPNVSLLSNCEYLSSDFLLHRTGTMNTTIGSMVRIHGHSSTYRTHF